MSKIEFTDVGNIKKNPKNPRVIRDERFKKLVKSITEFPKMLEIRPIVVNKEMMIIGGNMRYEAAIKAGMSQVPIIIADFTAEQEDEFVIKDNVSAGEFDFEALQTDWVQLELGEWGIELFEKSDDPGEVDYSIIDKSLSEVASESVEQFQGNVKRAIQVEFSPEDYVVAFNLYKLAKSQGIYPGRVFIEALQLATENKKPEK